MRRNYFSFAIIILCCIHFCGFCRVDSFPLDSLLANSTLTLGISDSNIKKAGNVLEESAGNPSQLTNNGKEDSTGNGEIPGSMGSSPGFEDQKRVKPPFPIQTSATGKNKLSSSVNCQYEQKDSYFYFGHSYNLIR